MTDNLYKYMWISWEKQRRSIELANCFGCKLFIVTPRILPSTIRLLRYMENSFRTILILLREKPDVLFVQNPSIALPLLAISFRKIFNFVLIVDRHSNFKYENETSDSIYWKVFFYISKLTIKHADLTIVTNNFLADLVGKDGGMSYVLQDKIPDMKLGRIKDLQGDKNVVFVSTFSPDEPVDEVILAAELIDDDCAIYITGNIPDTYLHKSQQRNFPSNVLLTGYLKEDDYQSLLLSADVLLVLTKNEHTLTCGTYEGVALEKCLIISDTKALRSYFNEGMVYVKSSPDSIAQGIREVFDKKSFLEAEVKVLKDKLVYNWEVSFELLEEKVLTLAKDRLR